MDTSHRWQNFPSYNGWDYKAVCRRCKCVMKDVEPMSSTGEFWHPTTGKKADDTLSWEAFKKFVVKKSTDPIEKVKLEDQFIERTGGLKQTGHIDRCIEAWETWLAHMESCDGLEDVYTSKVVLKQFLSCLKPKTKVSVLQAKPTDVYEAMDAAQEWDPILFEAERKAGGGGGNSGNASGSSARGAGQFQPHNRNLRSMPTPSGPPGNPATLHALQALTDAQLAALGFSRTAQSGQSGRNSGEGTVVYRGPYNQQNLPPKLTPAWKEWCRANRACFGCREPNCGHGARNCPVFPREANNVETGSESTTGSTVFSVMTQDLLDLASASQTGNE